jgi:hypothetical protein
MIEERKIIIGLITSTEYIQQTKDFWTVQLFESKTAKKIILWCMEYFEKYQKAPGKDLEAIYYRKKASGNFPKDFIEEMEETILPGLSEEFEQEGVNVDYLVDITKQYFTERNLRNHAEVTLSLLEQGKPLEAEKNATSFTPIAKNSTSWFDLAGENIKEKIHKAFSRSKEILIRFPGVLGEFWNNQLIRGAFVALLAPEKRGKSWWLLEFAMRAVKNKKRVAFFQAGDMDDEDQLLRIGCYLTGKAELESDAGTMFQPVKDCIYNQTNTCDKTERMCYFGLFEKVEAIKLRKTVTLKELVSARNDNEDYVPCTKCDKFEKSKWGTLYIEKIDTGDALTEEEAIIAFEEYFSKHKREFRLSTHSNGTLSVSDIDNILSIWEHEGFIPDVVIIDYADLLTENGQKEERHRQHKIWKDLRGLNQKRKCLLITATQADSASYNVDLITSDNYSEDKRKYGHATAFYGLNQDKDWREKELGIMRINELFKRKGFFSAVNQVHVLQNLNIGKPFIGSYW